MKLVLNTLMFNFKIIHQEENCKARTGIITTAHGTLNTPAFVPVATKATVKALTPKQIEELGFEAVLGNTYHLFLQPKAEIVEKFGGIAKFMGWNKVTFTDSGGFQVFSLSGKLCDVDNEGVNFRSCIDCSTHRFTPEISMQVQRKLGADLIFAFDQCLAINADYETTKDSLQRTHAWEKRSLKEFKKINKDKKQALYGIVQGGRFTELREESAKFIASLDFDALAIGSIFGDPKEESKELVEHAMKFLPEEKTKHLLGIGAVEDIFNYVELGLDTFDCVLPTRLARSGYVFFRPESGGKLENKFRYRCINARFKESKEPLDKNCDCYVCKNFTQAYLHHLFKAKELLFYSLMSYHNLYYFSKLMEEIREAITEDKFLELKEKWLS
jgi:queuine tRNA-ribosyltransferase